MSPPRLLASTPSSLFAATSASGSMPAWSTRRAGPQQSPTNDELRKASSPVSTPVSDSTGTAWTAPDGHLSGVLSYPFTPPSRAPTVYPAPAPRRDNGPDL
jgi:hypothetical protein